MRWLLAGISGRELILRGSAVQQNRRQVREEITAAATTPFTRFARRLREYTHGRPFVKGRT